MNHGVVTTLSDDRQVLGILIHGRDQRDKCDQPIVKTSCLCHANMLGYMSEIMGVNSL